MKEDDDQFEEIKHKFNLQKDNMRSKGVKVKDFIEIYEEQLSKVILPNPISKKAISYFESSSKQFQL